MRHAASLRLLFSLCLIGWFHAAVAAESDRLAQFARALGFPNSSESVVPDGNALTFWSIGLTEDAARVVFRMEMEDEVCQVRVTSVVQDPPNWGQLQVRIYDFSALADIRAFGNFDDMSSQTNPIDLGDAKANAVSLSGERLACTSFHDLGAMPPSVYPYCDARYDVLIPEDSSARAATLEAIKAVALACSPAAIKQ